MWAGILFCVLMAIVVATAMQPLVNYIRFGWLAKRNDIMDGLGGQARFVYFLTFAPHEHVTPANASEEFERIYDRWYGRRHFVLPGLLAFLTVAVAGGLVVVTAIRSVAGIHMPIFMLPDTAVAALAGAYMWVANDFISRGARLDFTPSDVKWAVLRLVVAVPMAYAFTSVFNEVTAPFVAFALGAFPMTTLLDMLRRFVLKKTALDASGDEAQDDIIKLQGVDKAIAARLAKQDITNIAQVAYCDPVRVTMGSNLGFGFVTDLMSQALAFVYLRERLDAIRPMRLRGAVEIKHFIDDLDGRSSPQDRQRAADAMPAVSAALGMPAEVVQMVLREIAADPYTVFLDKVWELLGARRCQEEAAMAAGALERLPEPAL